VPTRKKKEFTTFKTYQLKGKGTKGAQNDCEGKVADKILARGGRDGGEGKKQGGTAAHAGDREEKPFHFGTVHKENFRIKGGNQTGGKEESSLTKLR